MFCEKGVLINCTTFAGKHLCQSLFFNKVAGSCSFIKKEALAQVPFCKFCEISKNTYLTEHLLATAFFYCYFRRVLMCKYCEIFKNTYLEEDLQMAASETYSQDENTSPLI